MFKAILSGFILLIFLCNAFAILSNDAELAVSKANFLNAGEKAFVFNDIPMKYSDQKYWVVNIEESQSLKALLVVRDSDSNIESKQTVLIPLFKALVISRGIQERNPNSSWLISLTNSNRFQEFSNLLKNEAFDLDIVVNENVSSEINGKASALKDSLSQITQILDSLSSKVKQLNDTESRLFNVQTDAGTINNLSASYKEVFDLMVQLQTLSIAYDGDVAKIKNLISKSSADSQTKTQLIGLVNPLNQDSTLNSTFGSYVSTALENQQFLNTIYEQADSQVQSFFGEFQKRQQKVLAYDALYSLDSKFKKDSQFSSLKDAVDSILDAQNKSFWKDQVKVGALDNDWKNALKEFNAQQYTSTIELAKKAKEDAVAVVKAGYTEPQNQGFDFSQSAIQVLIALVVLVLAVFAFQKRKKILAMIHPQTNPNEGENYNSEYFKK